MPADPHTLLVWMVPLLALTGLVAGVLAGLLGVGGGIVIVPALYYVFDNLGIEPGLRMHLAVGTSLATIIPTSLRSARAHHQRGAVDVGLLRAWGIPMLVGATAGAWVATLVSAATLTLVFATVAFVVALHMGFSRRQWRLAAAVPRGAIAWPLAGSIGAVSAVMGIGGGSLSVPVLSLCGVPMHRAVGTAAAFGIVISIPAVLAFLVAGHGAVSLPPFSVGYVNLLGLALIVPMTLLAAPLGARLAHAASQPALRRAFATFLALTALRMLRDAVAGA